VRLVFSKIPGTHSSEYEVIRALAAAPAELALFGDFDQTSYEWRGSRPDEMLEQLEVDFAPVTKLSPVPCLPTTTVPLDSSTTRC
jgi:DNA helicase-2/ATP-dependent DNA helicase PcrA